MHTVVTQSAVMLTVTRTVTWTIECTVTHVNPSPQVVREVSGQSTGPEESASPVIPRKTELDKVSAEEVGCVCLCVCEQLPVVFILKAIIQPGS